MNYDECRQFLRIDRNDLDNCLQQQPEAYHHAAEAYILAVAQRDETKLILEELTAELETGVRKTASATGEKLTESAIQARLTGLPKIQTLTRKLLDAKLEADRWAALKESFQQRSHALRDLVALRLGERRDLAMESGSGQVRQNYIAQESERIREATADLRRQRRG